MEHVSLNRGPFLTCFISNSAAGNTEQVRPCAWAVLRLRSDGTDPHSSSSETISSRNFGNRLTHNRTLRRPIILPHFDVSPLNAGAVQYRHRFLCIAQPGCRLWSHLISEGNTEKWRNSTASFHSVPVFTCSVYVFSIPIWAGTGWLLPFLGIGSEGAGSLYRSISGIYFACACATLCFMT